jgi:hypothetical protein
MFPNQKRLNQTTTDKWQDTYVHTLIRYCLDINYKIDIDMAKKPSLTAV